MNAVHPLDAVSLRLADGEWKFALRERPAITRHWQELVVRHPYLWNGRILICTSVSVESRRLEAELVHTDFASFVAWRDWGWPDRTAFNCYGVPAVITSDGAMIMGVMGPRTLNRGMIYPPSGSLEPRDIGADGLIDIEGSMKVEFQEETGIDLGCAAPAGLIAAFDEQRMAIVRRFDLPMSFAAVEEHFARHIADDPEPELAAVKPVRSIDDIEPGMLGYVKSLITHYM